MCMYVCVSTCMRMNYECIRTYPLMQTHTPTPTHAFRLMHRHCIVCLLNVDSQTTWRIGPKLRTDVKLGSDDGFWLGPIPIGHELALPLHALALHTGCRHTHMHAHTYIHTYTISLDTFWLQLKPNGIDPCLFLKELFTFYIRPSAATYAASGRNRIARQSDGNVE